MIEFSASQTRMNLARAFAGECQAGARYQFIGHEAKNQELFYIQEIMKELAKNEMSHAKVFYKHILDLGGDKQNNIEISAGYPFSPYTLKEAFKQASLNELSEHKNIYPSFAKIASDEGYPQVSESFKLISKVEEQHFIKLTELDKRFNEGKLYKAPKPVIWKCFQCGYESTDKSAWSKCPLCDAQQGYAEINLENNND